MHMSFAIDVANSWCQISIYPFSWWVFIQRPMPGEPGLINIAVGPIRLTFN
jgi:hypothetical protein